jgi:ABC-type nitrate/sulfonate/bicarbonate transport system substrate-binding protein
MTVSYNAITGSRANLVDAINSGSDTWAFALTNTVPSATAFTAGSSDLSTGGGYTQGGENVSITSASESGGVFKLVLAAPTTWTASGSGFTFRYVLLVNKTNNLMIGYWDYGSSIVMNGTNGDTFAFTPDGTNGVFQVA